MCLRVVWVAYQDALEDLTAINANYTKLLVDLTVTLAGLKAVIEAQERRLESQERRLETQERLLKEAHDALLRGPRVSNVQPV